MPCLRHAVKQANNEAAATASTTPSESASAFAAASDAASASATPSPVITRGYSGGSKAPDGEYREADEYGIAQNVPLPKAKPQQYPETFAGLREMMVGGSEPVTTVFRPVTCSMYGLYAGYLREGY